VSLLPLVVNAIQTNSPLVVFVENKMLAQELLGRLLIATRSTHGKILVMHSSLTVEQRTLVGQMFNEGNLLVVLATEVFEMGIDTVSNRLRRGASGEGALEIMM
jgi:Lhr-like helicase